MRTNNLIVYFSKNRAMQLDLTLYSHKTCMIDWDYQKKVVLYDSTHSYFEQGYDILRQRFPRVRFIRQVDFKRDLIKLLYCEEYYEHVTFVVDDTIFCNHPFFFEDIEKTLDEDPLALGFSLRLGMNTSQCYSLGIKNDVPYIDGFADFPIGQGAMRYSWFMPPTGGGDFYYPLELSSSVYKLDAIQNLLEILDYNNPKYLEYNLSLNTNLVKHYPYLWFYKTSCAFSNPLNVTFENNTNRVGDNAKYDLKLLNKRYLDGQVIDFEPFRFFKPNGCHQEVDLKFISKEETYDRK